MSQDIFDTIDPTVSGTELAGLLNDFKDAIVSGLSGTSRPTELQAGGAWVDTANDPTSWSYKIWTGSVDIEVFEIDLVGGGASVSLALDSFIVRKVSADTVGALFNLVKRRIATNGQVLNGDVVGEIRMVGRDSSGGDPIVAKIIFEAAEDETVSAYGGTLTFYSTPVGQASLVAHMRFIGGMLETLVPLKSNSQVLVAQSIATASTIAQLSADKVIAEMTGSTTTVIQGINSGGASKVLTIHNRSSANVTVSNQNASAAAADRILLPESKDIILLPQESVTLYYSGADSRWKIQYASSKFTGFTVDTVIGDVNQWVAPASVTKARIVAHAKKDIFPSNQKGTVTGAQVLDIGKSLWAWGANANGALGVGDSVSHSSPILVLGGLRYTKLESILSALGTTIGLASSGLLYGWGYNADGELGIGDVLPRSSPVAVLGGLKFKSFSTGASHVIGLKNDGTPYAWGFNSSGQLGLNDVVPRSSPIAVLGGLKFRAVSASNFASFGIDFNGATYAWGLNDIGNLGVGDVVSRSTPVLVLGSLKMRKIVTGNSASSSANTFGITETNDLYAWGRNESGELGLGDVLPHSSPVAVLGGLKFREVIPCPVSINNTRWTVGVTTDGSAYAWGDNTFGQLGVGDTVARSSPVAVLGGLKFSKIITVEAFPVAACYGITEDGVLYAWGSNASGELGVGDVVARSSPVAVLGGLSFKDIAPISLAASVVAESTDGVLYAWGVNASGQLGLGDVVPRSSPVVVLGGLSLSTQDDSDTMLDLAISGGATYALKLGSGPCFFGSQPLGNDIYKVEISYVQ